MAKVQVLGAAGMLGHKLCQELSRRNHEVTAVVRQPSPALAALIPELKVQSGIDVLERDSLEQAIRKTKPDFVINAIGIVKQRMSESDKYISTAINAWLPHRLVKLCTEIGARLIQVSTDCVFDGTKGRYTETDPPDARDLYGKSKWLGEPDPAELHALTLRTSIIGPELRQPTHGLLEWFLGQKAKAVKGYARAIFSGLTTLELARVFAQLLESHPKLHGVYHVASSPISKFELLVLLRDIFKVSVEIHRDEEFICDRSLVMRDFTQATGYRAPGWPDMIRDLRGDLATPSYQR